MRSDGLTEIIFVLLSVVGIALKRYWPKIKPILAEQAAVQLRGDAAQVAERDNDPAVLALIESEAKRLEQSQEFLEKGTRQQYQSVRDSLDGLSIRLHRVEEFNKLFKPEYDRFKKRFEDLETNYQTLHHLYEQLKAQPTTVQNINLNPPPTPEGGAP